jgi:lysophospholipase L1-like esterase
MARYQASEREARYHKAREFGLPPVVTEGDSWFSYELYLNLSDRIDDAKTFALKRLESSGDTIENMVGYTITADGISALRKVVQQERPIFLFFSGGGNDIVGPELKGAIKKFDPALAPEEYLKTKNWKKLLGDLKTAYTVLAEEIGPLCPIFAHGYDFIVPSNRPVTIFPGVPGPGPWVWPEMTSADVAIVDPALQRAIGKIMIDQFNDQVLARLEVDFSGYFAHVDLRDTVKANQWSNEIHPTATGFKALAKRFLDVLDAKLPAVRQARAERLGGIIA